VILSGFADLKNVIESLRLRAAGFVSKPYDLVDLLGIMKRVLEEDEHVSELNRLNSLVSLLEGEIEASARKTVSLTTLRSLVAGLAHNLRSELTNIGATASSLKALGQNNPEILEECNMLVRSAEFGQLLLRRIMDFTKTSRVQKTALDPVGVVLKLKELVSPRLPSNVESDWIIKQEVTKSRFLADQEETLVVLTELINNSVFALRSTGGMIRVSCGTTGRYIMISIEDNGPGIPHQIRESLLTKRVNSKSGLGIGLYLCSRIVKSMNGKLRFVSEEGKGTMFTVLFPMKKSSKDT
jgi:signal transduction histidine kinase